MVNRWSAANARPLGLVFLFLSILLIAAAIPVQAATLHDGIPYHGSLKLDIYTPDDGVRTARAGGMPRMNLFSFGDRLKPVVVYAHGGGWIHGTRKHVYSIPQWLTSEGYVVVAIDYRMVPKTTVMGQVNDLVASIDWARAHIRDYGGDPRRIVIMGHSAGAHLVAMVAAQGRGGPLAGVIPDDVQAYDMVAYAGMRGGLGYPYIQAFGSDPMDWVRWSPVTYARQRTGGLPPHLFLHSGSDGARRKALTNGYANLLRSRGASVSVFDGHRYNHGTIARYLGRPGDAATAAIERFLERVTR